MVTLLNLGIDPQDTNYKKARSLGLGWIIIEVRRVKKLKGYWKQEEIPSYRSLRENPGEDTDVAKFGIQYALSTSFPCGNSNDN